MVVESKREVFDPTKQFIGGHYRSPPERITSSSKVQKYDCIQNIAHIITIQDETLRAIARKPEIFYKLNKSLTTI